MQASPAPEVHVNVLLSGGNDILLRTIATALLEESHSVRVSRSHGRHLDGLPPGVEERVMRDGDLTDAATGCDAIVLVDPGVTSSPGAHGAPRLPARGMKGGTNILRVIRVMRQDADDPADDGIAAAHRFTIAAGPVYGAGDDLITVFLIMMRSLPVVPVLTDTHVIRPVWIDDLARAVARTLSLPIGELTSRIAVAGPDRVTQDELYERIAALIDRRPLRVPVPDFLAGYGARLTEGLRLHAPFEASHLAFARAAAAPDSDDGSTTLTRLGITPTTLDAGLRQLVEQMPELTPSEGVGSVEVKRFSTRIRGGRYDGAELVRQFRARFREVMPVEVGVEPGAPDDRLDEGAVVTMALPGRGHVQVRVEQVADDGVVVSTLRGHALAGFVQFRARAVQDAVEFNVMTCDAAANALDWLALTLGGSRLQDANWTRLLQNVASLSGGTAESVESEARTLDSDEAANVDRWIRGVIDREKRTEPVSARLPKV